MVTDTFAPYSRSVLPNGLRLLTAPMPATRSVSIAFYIAAGSRYERDEEAGASHFLEHMLFKGTARRRTAQDVSETIERVGGSMNASTDRELTVYWARAARPHLGLAMDLLSDMLLNSVFDPPEVEKERGVILEELHASNDMPSQRAFLMADEVLWPGQPLGRDVAGTQETISAITRDMLVGYLADQYVPAQTALAVAGQIEHEEVEELALRHLSGWPDGHPRVMFPATGAEPESRIAVEYRRTEQANICLSLPVASASDPDRYSLGLLNAILGEGMASRLFLELRERLGLVYEVSSSVSHLSDTGAMTIFAGSDPAKGAEAVAAILNELALVKKNVTDSELERARELTKGRLLLGLENTRSVSGWLGSQEMLRDRIRTPEEVVAELDATTLDDVRAAANRFLAPDRYRLTIVGPYRSSKRFLKVMEQG